MNKLTKEDMASMITKIIDAGATPVIMCKCGRGVWMFETTLDGAYKKYTQPCSGCSTDSPERLLLADFREDLL